MALDFPANPSDGEVFGSYVWSASKGVWQSREESAAPAVVSPVPPTTSNPGDIWVDSSDGISYVYYDDGSSGQWIEMISSGVVSLAGKANTDSPTFTGNVVLPSTTSIGNISSTELGYIDGLTSSAQTQLTTNSTNIANLTNQVNQYINWIPITPASTNHYIVGSANIQITLNPSSIPSNARYLLCNIYITANISDHENFSFTRTSVGNQKNWVDTRGSNPDGQFGAVAQDSCVLTYFGEADGFTSNYGIWYSSQVLPVSGRQTWLNNFGNSGSNTYVYFVVRAYSL
jgi:hypothetical protein